MVEVKNVIIAILVVLVALLLIRVDTSEENKSEATKSLYANNYADDNYLYKEKVIYNYDYYHDKYDYCDYSDYDCDHNDYDCYFDRKKRCDKYYDEEEEGYTIYIVNEVDPERKSLTEYKYGYTYRTTEEYLSSKGEKVIIKELDYNTPSKAYTYYEYSPYLREYEEVTCYTSAPKGQLFYQKCSDF